MVKDKKQGIGNNTKISFQLSFFMGALFVAYKIGYYQANTECGDKITALNYQRLHELIIQENGGLRNDVDYYVKEIKEDIKENHQEE